MKKNVEANTIYVQPVCKIYQIRIQQMIAASYESTEVESLDEDDKSNYFGN